MISRAVCVYVSMGQAFASDSNGINVYTEVFDELLSSSCSSGT